MYDKADLQVFANHCTAAAESMAYVLKQTAHSTFVKETEDFTVGFTDPQGSTFASPRLQGAPWFVALDYGPAIRLIADYEEGDICVTNDPYSGYVCTHSPDMHMWKPVFVDGKIVCFAVANIHNTDMGGSVPGSLSRGLTEIHQEGLRFPPVKVVKQGKFNQDILDIMRINVRAPEQNWGDLKALVASVNMGERKVLEMIERFGIDGFRRGVADLMDHAEQQARDVVRLIPDGEYRFSDLIDEDSENGHPCRIAAALKVQGDSLTVDCTGSDPQAPSAINMPTGGQERHALVMIFLTYAFYALDKTLFLNAGTFRVAKAVLPKGSVLNAEFPAAVGMRSLVAFRLQTAILGAFSQAMPEFMPASPSTGGAVVNVKTTDSEGRTFMAAINPIGGGTGATSFGDGVEGCGGLLGFAKNSPIEITESEMPIKIIRYGLQSDSGGAGRWRGGSGLVIEFTLSSPQSAVGLRNLDRVKFASWGVLGGKPGKNALTVLNPGTDRERQLGNADRIHLGPGDVLRFSAAGAGGYGDPLDRPAELVLRDVRNRMVSEEAARTEYGVVIRAGAIAEKETAALRAEMRKQPHADSHFEFGAAREAFERIWSEVNYQTLMELLATLPVQWRSFMKHKIFEAMAPTDDSSVDDEGRFVRSLFTELVRHYPQIEMAN